jgi:mRNA-degrading endonuclease RelE of RelBE toxin-antitoxin system
MPDNWTVHISNTAEQDLKKLPPQEQSRIKKAIDTLENGTYQKNTKQLEGRPDWSLRVGRRRVIFRVDKENGVIVVTAIGTRGDIY